MNSLMEQSYPMFEHYQALRNQLMDILTEEDLLFRIRDQMPSLGALCREIGEIEQSYIDSFRDFTQDFSYRVPEAEIETNLAGLSAWYKTLDEQLKTVVAALTEEEIANRLIDRGGGFTVSPWLQLEIYKEALLIFYGKCSIYLKAMGKPFLKQWLEWIG